MAEKKRYEVVKFNKKTSEDVVFSTLNLAEAKRVAEQHNKELTPEERRKTGFRVDPVPYYKIQIGS
ncbi:MAG: hypothetical protein WB780_08025 [Candidatus Acidiferrales bacterium]